MVKGGGRTGLRGKPAGRQPRGERAQLEKEGKNVKMIQQSKFQEECVSCFQLKS